MKHCVFKGFQLEKKERERNKIKYNYNPYHIILFIYKMQSSIFYSF